MPTIEDKIKDDDKSKIIKRMTIAGISIGAVLLLIGIPLIYMAVKKKRKIEYGEKF